MADTSYSSSLSRDSETDGRPSSERPTLDMDGRGLAHILSFSDSDGEGCPYIKDYNLSTEASGATCTKESITSKSKLEYLDENANQASMECVDDPFAIPNTPSASPDHTMNCYMDLSLSSDSDLVFLTRSMSTVQAAVILKCIVIWTICHSSSSPAVPVLL